MTLPSSGAISISNFSTELGLASTAQNSISFIQSKTKSGYQYSYMSGYYGFAYYQKNNAGNCNNGNCGTATSSGNIQCQNCYPLAAVNCANCDATTYLQPNCNCACTYNCSQVANQTYNCNCNCMPATCFPAGAMVLMADGSLKTIETVQGGEFVMGADGLATEVQYLHVAELGTRKMYQFAEDGHEWSDEHLYWALKDGKQWWWSINPDQWRWEVNSGHVAGLKDIYSLWTGEGCLFAHMNGWLQRTPVRVDRLSSTKVYLPITKGVPVIVNGYVVTGGTDESVYDYNNFCWSPENIKFHERAA